MHRIDTPLLTSCSKKKKKIIAELTKNKRSQMVIYKLSKQEVYLLPVKKLSISLRKGIEKN